MYKKRIPNQSEEFAKYHPDINGTKSKYEKDFDPSTYNEMSGEAQLTFTKERFPIGSKVYTNLNCKPTECIVLGYEMKEGSKSEICNLLTNQNEVEGGYTWEHEGNTSVHPGWFYPKPSREDNLEILLNE